MLDLGFGKLAFTSDGDGTKIRFIPSEELVEGIRGIENGKPPHLKKKLDKTLSKRLLDAVKDF